MKIATIGMIVLAMALSMGACSNSKIPAETVAETVMETSAEAGESAAEKETEVETMAEETTAAETKTEETKAEKQESDPTVKETKAETAEKEYPGPDVVELVNAKGDYTTGYKLVDGTYMDRESKVYTYDGKETWTDENGAEWNEAMIMDGGDPEDAAVEAAEEAAVYPGPDVVELVNPKGDTVTGYKLADGTYMDRECKVYTYDGKETWTDENGAEWNETVK